MKYFGRIILLLNLSFIYPILAQSYHDLLITEIMADPSPAIGLPEVEYLEIYNRSAWPISLKGWKLVIGTRTSILPALQVAPGQYAIICHLQNQPLLSSYGLTVGLSAFNLPNEESSISLYCSSGQIIHHVIYKSSFWLSTKRDGGYALELIDLTLPCMGEENWATSIDLIGGTPGSANSVAESMGSSTFSPLEYLFILSNSSQIVIRFSRRIDSLSIVNAIVEMERNQILKRKLSSPDFRELILELRDPLTEGISGELHLSELVECGGESVRPFFIKIGHPSEMVSGDVVINEILFNPKQEGVDFIEIYNNSEHFVDIKNWEIANLKNGLVDVKRTITNENVILAPKDFLAITTNARIVRKHYPTDFLRKILEISAMPSYPNSNGGVALLHNLGVLLDQFNYSEKMHGALLGMYKGVSLERINPQVDSNDSQNWMSASSLVGYATPGYMNSQYHTAIIENEVKIYPEAFSPNNDGNDDVMYLELNQNKSGRIGSVQIFNANGVMVYKLIDQQSIGTSGRIVWDGKDINARLVPPGHYVVFIEIFDQFGYKRAFKKKVVVLY